MLYPLTPHLGGGDIITDVTGERYDVKENLCRTHTFHRIYRSHQSIFSDGVIKHRLAPVKACLIVKIHVRFIHTESR